MAIGPKYLMLMRLFCCCCFSVTKLCLTLCRPMDLHHVRLPCPSLSPRVCSDSCPLTQWCHPTISSSATPFSSCPQAFPASGSFPTSQLFTLGGQNIRASASVWVLPMKIQGWFSIEVTCLISLHPRDSRESSPAPQFEGPCLVFNKCQMLSLSFLLSLKSCST